jgi:hypothetical protein
VNSFEQFLQPRSVYLQDKALLTFLGDRRRCLPIKTAGPTVSFALNARLPGLAGGFLDCPAML